MKDAYEDIALEFAPQLIYTPQSIPIRELSDLFNEEYAGCECAALCLPEECVCMKATTTPKFECNANCQCSAACNYKTVLRGPRDDLCIRESGEKGLGLFTARRISEGAFICEYAGEYLTEREAKQRYQNYQQHGVSNYIIWIREHFGRDNEQLTTIIDPTRIGNIGRFINHCCQPNCRITPIRVNNSIPKLCVYAKRAIEMNEELHFDYGCENAEQQQQQQQHVERIECKCGSAQCKGYLPFHNLA